MVRFELGELLVGRVVQSVVHDAVLVELDLVNLDAVVLLDLAIHLAQVERLAAFFVILKTGSRCLNPSSRCELAKAFQIHMYKLQLKK